MVAVEAPRPAVASRCPAEGVPIDVDDIEMDAVLPSLPAAEHPLRCRWVLALVRVHSHPVGTVRVQVGPSGLPAPALSRLIHDELGPEIAGHLRRDGLAGLDLPADRPPRCLDRRFELLKAAPLVSVVVATRDRTTSLARCLDSVLASDYPRFEVVVVDNDPTSAATAALVASRYADRSVRYVREDRRGLAAAHNRGLEAAAGSILAFTDDDVVVDRHWLAAIAEGFELTHDVAAVTGLIQPGELRTRAQGASSSNTDPSPKAANPGSSTWTLIVRRTGDPPGDRSMRIRRQHGLSRRLPAPPRRIRPRPRNRHHRERRRRSRRLLQRAGFRSTARVPARRGGAALAPRPRFGPGDAGVRLWGGPRRLLDGCGRPAPRASRRASPTVIGAARRRRDTRRDSRLPCTTIPTGAMTGWPTEPDAQLGRRGAGMTGPFSYLASRWHARGAGRPA